MSVTNLIKFLCLCNGGNVRSAALARYIKDLNGIYVKFSESTIPIKYESISMGAHCSTIESLRYMIGWADRVIDLSDNDEEIQKLLQYLSGNKYIRVNIGGDVWGNSAHPNLLKKMEEVWKYVEERL